MRSFVDNVEEMIENIKCEMSRRIMWIQVANKRREDIETVLNKMEQHFLQKVQELKLNNIKELPPNLISQYRTIHQLQKKQFEYALEQKETAKSLSATVLDNYSLIIEQIKKFYPEMTMKQTRQNSKDRKKKLIQQQMKNYEYNNSDPVYCYCQKAESGKMIQCQNPYCEREWFHLNCTEYCKKQDDQLPDKWYCENCLESQDGASPFQLKYFSEFSRFIPEQDAFKEQTLIEQKVIDQDMFQQ